MRARRFSEVRMPAAAACALVIGVATAYGPSLSAGFVLDDESNLVSNPAIHWTSLSWRAVQTTLTRATLPSRPVANLTFALNHWFGGLTPFGYHLVNLLIHLAVAAALWWVGYLLATESGFAPRRAALISMAGAALFALHPSNTQAVTYTVQRMTTLATLFSLVAFAVYLRARRQEGSARVRALVVAAAAWALAVASKEIALALPGVVAAYEVAFHRERWRRFFASGWHRTPSGIALTITTGILSLVVISYAVEAWPSDLSTPLPKRDFSASERVLTQFRVQLHYLSLVVWPAPSRLSLEHDITASRGLLSPWTTAASLAFLLAAVIVSVRWLLRRPWLGFPLVAYGVLHVIESGPINLELVFEHRIYAPLAFLSLLVLPAGRRLVSPSSQHLAAAAVVCTSLAMAAATYQRTLVWGDTVTLMRDAAHEAPNNPRAHYNLGRYLGLQQRWSEAHAALLRAWGLDPTDGQIHTELGTVLVGLGRMQEAHHHFEQGARYDPTDAIVIMNYAGSLYQRGEHIRATREYEKLLRMPMPAYCTHIRQLAIRQLRAMMEERTQRRQMSSPQH